MLSPTTALLLAVPTAAALCFDATPPAILPSADTSSPMVLSSTTGQDATVMTQTTLPLGSGAEVTVEVLRHDLEAGWTGYVPNLVLFLAREDTPLETLTTNDNGYGGFQAATVAQLQAKIHATIGHTWFYVRAGGADGTTTSGGVGQQMLVGAFRLRRDDDGSVRAFYRTAGSGVWVGIGAVLMLPEELRGVPLKAGLRVKREWRSWYHFEVNVATSPEAGCVVPEPPTPVPSTPGPPTPAPLLPVVCVDATPAVTPPESGSAMVLSSTTGQDATVMTQTTLPLGSGAEVTVEVLRHDLEAGWTGYVPNLVLFLAREDTPLETLTTNDNGYGGFQAATVAQLQAKIHATIGHTWFYVRAGGADGTTTSGGVGQQMLVGAFRLRRDDDGSVRAFYRTAGSGVWVGIGAVLMLPEELRGVPLKAGLRVKREWRSWYHFEVNVATSPEAGCVVPEPPTPVPPTPEPPTAAPGTEVVLGEGNTDHTPLTVTFKGEVMAMATIDDVSAGCMLRAPRLAGDDAGYTSFDVEVLEQGLTTTNAYESFFQVYLARATAELVTMVPEDEGTDSGDLIAAVTSRIHTGIDHTWINGFAFADGVKTTIYSGVPERLTGGYALRLERRGGVFRAYVRLRDGEYLQVGGDLPLAAADHMIPLKAGIRVFKWYLPSYSFRFRATLRAGDITTEPPPPPETPAPTLPPACSPARVFPNGTRYIPKGIGGGGAMSGLSMSPHDDVWFVGTDMGTLFRSVNAGRSWLPISHRETRQTYNLSVATGVGFTADASIMVFAACVKPEFDCVAVRTTDAGVTWSPVDINGDGMDLSSDGYPVLAAFPKYYATSLATPLVLCAAADRLHASNDYGATWAPVLLNAAIGVPVGTYVDDSTTPPTIYHATATGIYSWQHSREATTLVVWYDIALEGGAALLSFAASRGRNGSDGPISLIAVVEDASACDFALDAPPCGRVVTNANAAAAPGGFVATAQHATRVHMAANDARTVYAIGDRKWPSARGTGVWVGTLDEASGVYAFERKFLQADVANAYAKWPADRLDYSAVGLDVGYWDGGYYWFAVHPRDSSVAGGSGNFFLHVTRDRGVHWESVFTEHAECGGGTPQAGQRWRSVGLEVTSVRKAHFNPYATNQLFASVADIRALRSVDGGDTFQIISAGIQSLNTVYDYAFASDRIVFACGGNFHDWPRMWYKNAIRGAGGVFYSLDAGVTWRRLGRRLSKNCDDRQHDTECAARNDMVRQFLSLAYDAGSGTLYAGSHSGGVARLRGVEDLIAEGVPFYLADAVEWEWINTGLYDPSGGVGTGGLEDGVIIPQITVSPVDDTVYCLLTSNPPAYSNTDRTGVYLFDPVSASWVSQRGPLVQPAGTNPGYTLLAYPTSFALDPSTGAPLYISDMIVPPNYRTSGLWKRDPAAGTWSRVLHFTHCDHVQIIGNRVYASGVRSMSTWGTGTWGPGGFMYSDDAGGSWASVVDLPLVANAASVTQDPADPTKLFFSFTGGGMLHGPAP